MKLTPSINTLPSGATRAAGQIDKQRTCAVIPGKTKDSEGFVDTRNELGGLKVYVSCTAVREMGRLIGLVDKTDSAKELQAARDEIETLKLRLEGVKTAINTAAAQAEPSWQQTRRPIWPNSRRSS